MPALNAKHSKAKLESLLNFIQKFNKVAIAFSGGVDSTFLAAAAEKVLPKRTYLVTTYSETFSAKEMQLAKETGVALGLPHVFIESDEFNCPEFVKNNSRRCYYCKKAKLSAMQSWAYEEDIPVILEGTNKDDDLEIRPGKEAIKEIKGVYSPLNTLGFTKQEIRNIAKQWNISNWNKPSTSCLATKINNSLTITKDRLKQVELAEEYLHKHNFGLVKIRHHGNIAKVELINEFASQYVTTIKSDFEKYLKQLDFTEIYYKIKFSKEKSF